MNSVTLGDLGLGAGLAHLAGRILAIVITLLLTLSLLRVLRASQHKLLSRLHTREMSDIEAAAYRQRVDTVLRVAYEVLRVMVLGFAGMTVLGDLGVSVQPLVAGAGLLGAAVALGSQTIVKDFVSGFFVLLEGHLSIGDTVTIAGVTGVVERMTLRVTILRDLEGAVHVVPNGAISAVTNKTYRWSQTSLTISLSASTEPETARKALAAAAADVAARDPKREILLSEVVASGPVALRGANIDWTLSVKVQSASSAMVKGWLIEATVKALRDANLPIAI